MTFEETDNLFQVPPNGSRRNPVPSMSTNKFLLPLLLVEQTTTTKLGYLILISFYAPPTIQNNSHQASTLLRLTKMIAKYSNRSNQSTRLTTRRQQDRCNSKNTHITGEAA